jgi:protein-tyrosine-phosphatase
MASIALMLGVLATSCPAADAPPKQVLFVCEHGNVKSLMAASYFNQRAAQRHLPFQAISRGSAPNSTSVPDAIRSGLRDDGFDVSDFRPAAVTGDDIAASLEVVTIGTDLPADAGATGTRIERWNDVPAASTNYAASRESLKTHVEELLDRLDRDK